MYLITMAGNCLLLITVRISPMLHTPMYFFLSNLSLIDIGFSSTVVPVILKNTLSTDKSISVGGCVFQMFCFSVFGTAECVLLAVMAYDRFVAICRPLHYSRIMNMRFHIILALIPWLTVVTLYYGTIMFMYLRPRSAYLPETDKTISVLYTVVTPMLNPFIYSVRNKDVKYTVKMCLTRK
ncbi:olfactory receptor 469-like [Bufo bufo]|uniref:olfactory receptor 469-like n=1 Tax=Bufo bufo TaxID=8384 RepID=UPI001ABDFE3D|nr:olfactory receptor 469-like [Bufo bufo]